MTTGTSGQTHLSSVQIDVLRQELQEQLARRRGHLAGLQEEASEGTGADETWQELSVSIVTADRAVAELTQALDRLAEGGYGRCAECEAAIPFERLKIRPLARYCIACQRRHEAA
ncbi:TraR/DksA family transcriptional regulator [Nonomuraea rhodomycinica]|uniref:TraR/DksA family transcriptional regulator n=1 Tax=Nonomuraea rhodomycinica TaxID=1712872 RepID=A0A7Y6M9Q4_9ACTN|nr:TraR/DksA family transcriptional regulator [Nonomuraea rhodomycinica]NUW38644.1 TraR/DksA family transcriptional regulator [Nonomuraea rhodomycinica]